MNNNQDNYKTTTNKTTTQQSQQAQNIMSCPCDVMYSPFLKCEEPAFGNGSGGKKLCIFHLYHARKADDCTICLDNMCGERDNLYMLSCGHMFHTECLAHCRKPQCPVCRSPLLPEEAACVFQPTVLHPIALKLYSLPEKSIQYVLATFEIVLTVARVGNEATQVLFSRLMRHYGALFA